MSFCILYNIVSENHSVQYPCKGEEGLFASRDLMSFELSLYEN